MKARIDAHASLTAPTLDTLAERPELARTLSPEQRAGVTLRVASILAALAVAPDASAGLLSVQELVPALEAWLTVDELHARTKLSRAYLYELIRAGKIPKQEGIGRAVRVPASWLASAAAQEIVVSN